MQISKLKIIVLALIIILVGFIMFFSLGESKFRLSFKENLKIAFEKLLASTRNSFQVEIVDEGGLGNSFALSLNKNPSASYIIENKGLIFAEKTDNTSWRKEVVDSEALAGNATSLAFNNKGEPNILYIDKKFSLKLASKTDKGWKDEKIFDGAALSLNLVFDRDDNPNISFWSTSKGALTFGKKIEGEWKIEIVDSGEIGWWNDLSLDKKFTPNGIQSSHISYYDFQNKDLLYAFFDGNKWQKEIVDIGGVFDPQNDLDGKTVYTEEDAGRWNSISLDAENRPYLSYFDEGAFNLKFAKKGDGGWEIETVNKKGGERTNIALDERDNPIISYVDSDGFKLAKKINNSWQFKTVELGKIGDNSLLIDDEGGLYILWHDLSSGQLKYSNLKSSIY